MISEQELLNLKFLLDNADPPPWGPATTTSLANLSFVYRAREVMPLLLEGARTARQLMETLKLLKMDPQSHLHPDMADQVDKAIAFAERDGA